MVKIHTSRIGFNIPLTFERDLLVHKKPLTKIFLAIGAAADSYLSIKPPMHISKLKFDYEEGLTKEHVLKTALKVISYVLTIFILPILALPVKAIYRHWVEKNILPSIISLSRIHEAFPENSFSFSNNLAGTKITNLEEDLKKLPLPGKTKEENERLSKIRFALPLNDEALEKLLIAQSEQLDTKVKGEHRKKFPFFTNTALINGLPMLKMTATTLVKDMTTLMLDPYTPLCIKINLLDLFKILLESPYYVDELKSLDSLDRINFLAPYYAIMAPSFEDKFAQVLELCRALRPSDEQIIEKEKINLPAATDIINDSKIEEIRKVIKGESGAIAVLKEVITKENSNEMSELTTRLAESFSRFNAAYFKNISHQEFVRNPGEGLQALGKASAEVLEPLKFSLRNSLYKKDEDDKKTIEDMKRRYMKFIGQVIKKSYALGDFLTASTLTAMINDPKKSKLSALLTWLRGSDDELKKVMEVFSMSNKCQGYKAKEADYMKDNNSAMIAWLTVYTAEAASVQEEESAMSMVYRIAKMNTFYQKFHEFQRRAALYFTNEKASPDHAVLFNLDNYR